MKVLATSDHGTTREIGVIDGQDRLISARSLSHYPVALVLTTTVADALANWKRGAIAMAAAALAIGLVIGGVVVICVWLVGRKLCEQSLQRDMALDNMSQGLAMFNSAARLVVCNDRYRQIYDFPPDLVKPGCAALDLVKYHAANGTISKSPETYVGDLLNGLAQGRPMTNVVALSDGRTISIMNQPIAGGGWVATHEDVTDKVNAENAKEEKKHQLDAALDNMSQGLCMFDAEQRLIVCNKRYAEIYGLNEEQTKPGTTLHAILEHRISAGNAPENHEKYFADRLREVTEAKLREESFRLLFKGSPVPLWVVDRESFRFLAVNDAAVAHYGYSREQFMAMTVLDIRAAVERDQFLQRLQTLPDVQTDDDVGQHLKADGSKIDVSVFLWRP